MARYIDADILLEQLSKKKSEVAKARYTDGFNDAIMRVRSMIHSAPTIDFIPRIKYEEVQELNDNLELCVKYWKLEYEKVIRQIFAEIEIFVNSYIKGIDMLEPQNEFCGGGKTALEIVIKNLAELKKKYEGEEI